MNKSVIASIVAVGVIFSGVSIAFAEMTGSTTQGTSTSTQTGMPKPVLDVACIQNAIEKRDTVISVGVDTFATSMKSDLSTRKEALKAAWAITKAQDRRAARKAAWATYSKSAKDAHTALKTVRNSAWSVYKTDLKSCKVGDAGEGPADTLSSTSL